MRVTPLSNEPAAVILDFDGVIADSMGLQEDAWKEALRRVLEQPEPGMERCLMANLYGGKSGSSMFDDVELDEVTGNRLRATKDALWHGVRDRAPLVEGAGEGIRRLAERYPLAVATSSERRYVEAVLEREGLLSCFSTVLTNADVVHPKPAPDLLRKIAERLEVSVEDSLLVGDTRIDFEMARAAGCPFLLMTATQSPLPPTQLDAARVGSWEELTEQLLPQSRPAARPV